MKKHRILFVMGMFSAPLLSLADCSGDSSTKDGGADAAKDTTTADMGFADTFHPDVKQDVSSSDAPSDTTTPDAVFSDVGSVEASTDASDAADGGSSWHTITCDGVIGTGEYGGSDNQTMSGTQTWYMTWDATNLYVALDNATLGEANIIYVGFSGLGTKSSYVYDSTGGTLPFAADGVVYAKSGYNETRIFESDAGVWGSNAMGSIQFCSPDAGMNTREEVIPWTALGATGLPSSFRFLAYATSSMGYIYAQIPTTNPSGQADAGLVFPHDFYVPSTANGTGSFPFATVE